MKNHRLACALPALALIASCASLDNPFDAKSEHYVGDTALRSYIGGDDIGVMAADWPLLNNVDITESADSIGIGMECTLVGCISYNYRASPNGGTTIQQIDAQPNGIFVKIKKDPKRTDEYWFDCQCSAPTISHWAGWTRVALH